MNYCKRPQDGLSETQFEMIAGNANDTWSIGLFKQAISPSTKKMCCLSLARFFLLYISPETDPSKN